MKTRNRTQHKDVLAKSIAERDGVTEGIVCLISAVESCFSFQVVPEIAGSTTRRQPVWRRVLAAVSAPIRDLLVERPHGRGLNGRAIDFAKFGQLFLDFGTWVGEQIISPEWVKESTSPDPSDDRPWLIDQDWPDSDGYYRHQWWGPDHT